MAHRDFIVLIQFSMSNIAPFAHMCRKYITKYVDYFPPIFFKGRVIESLAFGINCLSKKLNLNYSNISEFVSFPHFNQDILTDNAKVSLNQQLMIMLSALSNLYFQAFIISRYLTKSIVDNYMKSSKDYYADAHIGKQYLSYLTQIEPELDKPQTSSQPNYFLLWMEDPKMFEHRMKFKQSSRDLFQTDSRRLSETCSKRTGKTDML
jgi:hypothetical protein